MKLILGSASPRRKKILTEMGYDFEVVTADIDEKAIRDQDPKKLTLAIANAKADAIIPKLTEPAILITADLVVVFEDKILEKPKTKIEARETLESIGEKPSETVCSVVVSNTLTGKRVNGTDVVKVFFKPFTEEMYKKFVDSGDVLDHAGSYAVEHPAMAPFVEKIEGAKDSVSGLPKELTHRLIEEVQ